jgi:heat-inducible transcriptional repressor
VFDRLEIVNLGGSRYLLILSMKNGLVRTINLTLDHVLMRTRVEETARILSDRLHGLTIGEIKNTIGDRMRHLSGGDRILVDVILSNREQIFSSDGQENIHISGISRLLELPEFSDVQNSQKLINLSENKLKISDHLWARFSHSTGMAIDIGESDLLDGALPLSIVAASCFSQGTPGILGVIGPTRIDYPRILAIIKHTASMTTHFFSS